MKKTILLLAFFSFISAPLSAKVIWFADPDQSTKVTNFFKRLDDGNYPQDYCKVKGDHEDVEASTVEVLSDEELGKVWKINKPNNRKRGEFARVEGQLDSFSPKEGDDIYLAWQWKIDTVDKAKIDKEVTVFQWKSASPHNQNYPLNLEYDGELTLNAWGPNYVENKGYHNRRTVLWRKAVPQNEWVSIVIRIKVNKEDFGGLVQFWFNGEQQILENLESKEYQVKVSDDKKTVFHRTNDGRFVYPKWGVYNKRSCQYDVNAYFHNMKLGTSLATVMPKL
ncbi:polysaccharide lyase [Paraglaciecola aquimarina]|uniref:Polysaccharide lyase n=1 Tax=Paraglaciecola algarum TaxID=3050085 RepID=A0ABS9D7F5_9ALTE|nr:heparin lyase I family protein [Paraglaciecola sp. G1-23]MCF2948888.1 polysaccharide lyase [Paraglaciecola sp. G1-23]